MRLKAGLSSNPSPPSNTHTHTQYHHHQTTEKWVDTARGVLRSLEKELGAEDGSLALHLDGPAAVIHDAVRINVFVR